MVIVEKKSEFQCTLDDSESTENETETIGKTDTFGQNKMNTSMEKSISEISKPIVYRKTSTFDMNDQTRESDCENLKLSPPLRPPKPNRYVMNNLLEPYKTNLYNSIDFSSSESKPDIKVSSNGFQSLEYSCNLYEPLTEYEKIYHCSEANEICQELPCSMKLLKQDSSKIKLKKSIDKITSSFKKFYLNEIIEKKDNNLMHKSFKENPFNLSKTSCKNMKKNSNGSKQNSTEISKEKKYMNQNINISSSPTAPPLQPQKPTSSLSLLSDKTSVNELGSSESAYEVDEKYVSDVNNLFQRIDQQKAKQIVEQNKRPQSEYLLPNKSSSDNYIGSELKHSKTKKILDDSKSSVSFMTSASNVKGISLKSMNITDRFLTSRGLFRKSPFQVYNYAIHLNLDSNPAIILQAKKTCIRQPVRPLPYVIHVDNSKHLDLSESDYFCQCANKCGKLYDKEVQRILKSSLDLREAGLLDIREGEKLEILGVYMEPRILVRNMVGQYGLVRKSELVYSQKLPGKQDTTDKQNGCSD